jgi:hypothetical protein
VIMRNLGVTVIALAMSAPATAGPVYLTCVNAESNADGTRTTFNITIDESGATLSEIGEEASRTLPAVFTAGEVRASDRGDLISTEVRLDRRTGAWTKTIQVGQQEPIVSRGRCKIDKTPKRQF